MHLHNALTIMHLGRVATAAGAVGDLAKDCYHFRGRLTTKFKELLNVPGS